MKTKTKNCPPLPLPSPRGANQTALVISITSAAHIRHLLVCSPSPWAENTEFTSHKLLIHSGRPNMLSLPLGCGGAGSSGALVHTLQAPNIFVTAIPVSCGTLKLIITGRPVECPPGCSPDKVVFHFRVQRCLIVLIMRACLLIRSIPAPSREVLEYRYTVYLDVLSLNCTLSAVAAALAWPRCIVGYVAVKASQVCLLCT